MSDMSLETLLASALATGGSGGGGGSYDDTELRRRVTTLEGEVNSIDTQKLDELADIKSIGNGLALDANGELTATGGGGSTDWNDITNKPTDLVEDANYVHTDNNFTTSDKDKLAGLSNYDDTALQGEVDALDASLVSLVQTVAKKGEAFVAEYNVTTAQQIIEFINGNHEPCAPMVVKRGTDYYTVITATKVADNRVIIRTFATLSGVFYIFTYDITDNTWANNNYGVQKLLVSGTDIKTINGQSVLGSGNLEIGGGGSTSWNEITGKPTDLVQDADYVHTDNNFTDVDKDNVALALHDSAAAVETAERANETAYNALGVADQTHDLLTSQVQPMVEEHETAIEDRYTKAETDALLDGKQDALVSGTNIKTINGQSITGEGNLEIGGGTGGNANFDIGTVPLGGAGVYEVNAILSNNDSERVSAVYSRGVNGELPDWFSMSVNSSLGSDTFTVATKGYADGLVADKVEAVVIDVENFNMRMNDFVTLFYSDKLIYIKDGYLNHLVTDKYTWDLLPETEYELSYIEGGISYTYQFETSDDIYYRGRTVKPIGYNLAVGEERLIGTYKEAGLTYNVYSKVIKIDALPATAGITNYPHGIKNIKQILQAYGFTTDGFVLNAPRQTTSDNIAIYQVSKNNDTGSIAIEVGKDRSSKSAYVCLVYAKNN